MRSGLLVVTATALLSQVIPAGPEAAAATLTQDLTLKGLLDSIVVAEKVIEDNPDDHEARTGLAAFYLRAGRPDDAVTQLQTALRLEPEHAPAHYNLGLLLQMQGDADGAVEQYRLALEIALNDAETHSSLAQVLAGQEQWEDAIAEYLLALETMPNLLSAVVKLAWLRSTAPDSVMRDTDHAVALAERAADLTNRRNFIVMDTLGAAYAAAGRFDDAIATANTAIALAQAEGEEAALEPIRARVTMYLTYRPFRTPR